MLQQLQQQLLPVVSPHAVYPFQGGAVGLFSYDLGRRFESFPTIAAVDTQLLDMSVGRSVGLYDWALIADHQQQCLLICQGDCSKRLRWLQQQRHATQIQPFQLTGPWVANMSRSDYCGSIGYISCCGTLDTNIAIRTLLAEKNRLYCWAGGAIIADSEVEAEYQETFDKLNKILPLLKFGEQRNRKLA